ncbi:hypothetical protein [Gemmobacter denitrificans]|uniref:Uncharacterized protein n=1 Tax=Gemmobacter denitrificans TaxID=3123040 RepID=A0ABU8BX21_9RHOB
MQTTLAYAPTPEELFTEDYFDSPVIFHHSVPPAEEEPEQGEP